MRPLNKAYFQAITATANGAQIFASSIIQISITGVGTGTLAGAVKMQASNDWDPSADLDSFIVANWVDVADVTVDLTAAGKIIIPKTDVCYQWVRFVFTSSGGTGTLSANLKTVGV